MLFCIGARARAVCEIVDNNILFPHLMMVTSAHFAYVGVATYSLFSFSMISFATGVSSSLIYKVLTVCFKPCCVLIRLRDGDPVTVDNQLFVRDWVFTGKKSLVRLWNLLTFAWDSHSVLPPSHKNGSFSLEILPAKIIRLDSSKIHLIKAYQILRNNCIEKSMD